MKIEKINENQIRCTLTSADLIERQLKLSELAFGTEKAKSFFQDMMEQAHDEFGFEFDNIPLMIEATPSSPDSIVLTISKIVSPDDIDPRLSRLSPDKGPAAPEMPAVLDLEKDSRNPMNHVKIFAFQQLDQLIRAAHVLDGIYDGSNSLYKDLETNDYFLVISKEKIEMNPFGKICNILTEYGVQNASSGPALAFLEEHCTMIINSIALQTLAQL